MNRIFGLAGYACNGKSTILSKLAKESNYEYVDLPEIYRKLAKKNGYSGVTEWYTNVGLKEYKEESVQAVTEYIENEVPKNRDLLIDDIFDIDVYNKIIEIFPQICIIGVHSYFDDRVKRLGVRRKCDNAESITYGIRTRDNMKNFCGIQGVFTKCAKHIENDSNIEELYEKIKNEINKNLIICILGYSGSGKSTINEILSERLHIPIFKYGKNIREIVNEEGFDKSRDFVLARGINEYIRKTNLEMIKRIDEYAVNNRTFLIDGLVSNSIFNKLNNNYDVFSIAIKVDDSVRAQRIAKRENLENDKGIDELFIKDSMKISNGLDIIMCKCNNFVDGSMSIEEIVNEVVSKLTYECYKKYE